MGGSNNKPTKRTDSSGCVSLRDKQLTAEIVSAFLDKLHSNSSVTEVCISNCSSETTELQKLISGILRLETVLRIDLSAVKLGPEGVEVLTPLLTHSPPKLHSLVLNDCCLGNAGTVRVCRCILDTGLVLRNLELGSNGITSSGLMECSDLLRAGLVRGLSLFDNDLCFRSADSLSAALSAGSNLTWLSLGHNRIGPEGCDKLARGLRGSGVLWLALGCNKIGDRGARSLSLWLQDASCELRNLGISQNQITDAGALFILRALRTDHCSLRCDLIG